MGNKEVLCLATMQFADKENPVKPKKCYLMQTVTKDKKEIKNNS